MRSDRELERQLEEVRVPGEAEAEDRSWDVIRAAYAEREPLPAPAKGRRVALALAGGAAVLAIGLSPAGAKVADVVSDVFSPGVGEPDAKPALRSLPAAGELLVESEQGPWIVRDDGSKRLLGDYEQATWSPRGLFLAVTSGRELIAVDPLGNARWTVAAPAAVRDPRWAPSGFRIAYRSGGDLWVVAGDGTGARRVDRNVAPVAPVWRPIGDSKLAAQPGLPGAHVLTYLERDREWVTVDVDTGERLRTTAAELEQLSASRSHGPIRRAVSQDGRTVASLRRTERGTALVVQRYLGGPRRVLFAARGKLTGPTWSPDGNWLLVGWPAADQWLFIPAGDRDRLVAFDRISEQFDPGDTGGARFPRVSGWVLPQR